MVMFFKPQKPQVDRYFDLKIESLDGHCIGVGKKDDRIWFVPNTMIGDEVKVEKKEAGKKTGTAIVQKFYKKSEQRCAEKCIYTSKCGGCSCQFIPHEQQIKAKIDGLKQIFSKNVNIKLPDPDSTIIKSPYHYRRTCRLSTYFDNKSDYLHLGFREKNSHNIIDIDSCAVLKENLSDLINPLRVFLNTLSTKYTVGHVELTSADNGVFVLIRFAQKFPGEPDIEKYRQFCIKHNINGFIQTDDSLTKIYGTENQAEYTVNNIKYLFRPNDFIQINEEINQEIISQAVSYLDLKSSESVMDLFCGIGNFSLQLAARAKQVCGIEVVKDMVEQASANARINNLSNTKFIRFDLSENLSNCRELFESYDAVLLDPGRKGAKEISEFLGKSKIKKIVYVSCNPITATRDFKIICNHGFKIKGWSIFDMFPHTEHVETVVLLSRCKA